MFDPPSMLSWLGTQDGRVIGHAGFAFNSGYWIGFCDLNEEARAFPRQVIKASVEVMDAARDAGIKYVYVQEDLSEDTALKWLIFLGFRPDPRSKGELFRWRAKDWRAS